MSFLDSIDKAKPRVRIENAPQSGALAAADTTASPGRLWDRALATLRWYQAPLLAAALLALVARGQAVITPGYSGDDYGLGLDKGMVTLLLSDGRYGFAAIWWLRSAFGLFGVPAAGLSAVLSTLLLVAAGLFCAFAVLKRPTRVEAFLFAAVVALHPFATEFFHFAGGTLNMILAITLACASAAVALAAKPNWRTDLAAGVGLAAALSIYQLAIAHLGEAWLLAAVWALLSAADAGQPALAVVKRLARAVGVFIGGVVLYVATYVVVPWATGIGLAARGDVTKLKLSERVSGLELALGRSLWPGPGLITHAASIVLLVLLAAAAGTVVWFLVRRQRPVSALASLVLMTAAIAWGCGATVLSGTIWMVPRIISPVSVAFAGILALGWRVGPRWLHWLVAGGVAILCVSYLGASNRILFDTRRVNLWDFQQVNRIIGRLEASPDFKSVQAIAMVGGTWGHPTPLPTNFGDMNQSALSIPWAKRGLITEATGFAFRDPTLPELNQAEALCKQAPAWPDPASTQIRPPLAIVCLPKP